jgi:protein ImuA
LPAAVRAALWRADALGTPLTSVVSSGWPELDQELPGGGWPCHALTEVLRAQPSVLEWRLLGPALRAVVANGKTIVVVGPPKAPHIAGLAHCGIDERHFVWIAAAAPAERLWCTEQLVKSNGAGALLAWLPQARPEQIRRLQVCAQACEGLVVLFRPQHTAGEASAAPLRVQAGLDPDWALRVQVLKRRGALLDTPLVLHSVPGGLEAVLTPRASKPGALIHSRELAADVVGSNVIALRERRNAGVH